MVHLRPDGRSSSGASRGAKQGGSGSGHRAAPGCSGKGVLLKKQSLIHLQKQWEYDLRRRFNRAGGGADMQLVARGGPGADDAAQRVETRRVEKKAARGRGRRARIVAMWDLLAAGKAGGRAPGLATGVSG